MEYVRTQEEFRDALKRSYTAAANERVSSLINVQALKEFTSARNYPPGKPSRTSVLRRRLHLAACPGR